MKSAIVGTLMIALLTMSCAYCASQPVQPVQPVQHPDLNSHLGGPGYRVFDVDEIDSIDGIPLLRKLYRVAEECTGQTRPFSDIRVFAVSKIEQRISDGWFDGPVGLWTIGTGWIYLKSERTAEATARTLIHEYVHYITQLHHPEIDETIAACNAYINERTNK